jgi:hypothetical protein
LLSARSFAIPPHCAHKLNFNNRPGSPIVSGWSCPLVPIVFPVISLLFSVVISLPKTPGRPQDVVRVQCELPNAATRFYP